MNGNKFCGNREIGSTVVDHNGRDGGVLMRRIIDSHAHLVQYIAGPGAGGELRSIGNGMAIYANGQIVRMIPEQFHGDSVSPEQILEVMDQNGVEKAVLLQGNFYGFQNYYTAEAVKKYPDRFVGAGSYDPFSRDRDGIRKYLCEELGVRIEKFEVSTGSGLMAVHPDLKMDGEVMEEACDYAQEHGHVFTIDIGKCGSASWQVEELRTLILHHPNLKFVVCHLLAPSRKDEEKLRWGLERLKLPNVWFDLASVVHNCRPDEYPFPQAQNFVRIARDLVGADRLLFGTDIPSALKEEEYERYVNYLEEIQDFTEEEKDLIFYKNADYVYFGDNKKGE